MSEYDELVEVLTFLFTKRLQAKLEFTRGLLGDGLGNTDVTDRDGFSFIRPDRSTSKVFEMFNKMAFGVDGTPILIGELPWQPGLIQVVGIDWETYMQVGWDSRFAGLAKHGNEHIWRDGQPGADTFNIFRRQIWPLRTEPVGSGSTSVTINPYDYINHAGSRRAWPGAPGIDLSAALPASSGSQRYALVYWDYTVSGSVYGQLGVATGTLAVNAPTITPSKPIEPVGSIPSAFVRLVGTQQTVTDLDIVDARPLWGDGSIFNIDRAHVSRLHKPDNSAIVVQTTNAGFVGIGTVSPGTLLDISGAGTVATFGDGVGNATIVIDGAAANPRDIIFESTGGLRWIFRVDATAESGGDVGSDFVIVSRDDAGAFKSNTLFIKRSSGNVGIGTSDPAIRLDIVGTNQIRVADVETDATRKIYRIQGRHYTNAQQDASILIGNSDVSTTELAFGGGDSPRNAVTLVSFWTGATNTTAGGSEKMRINNVGDVGIGTTSPQGILHSYDAISGFINWEFDGLDATVRTIIPNGTGDVLYRLTALYVLRDSAAAVASGPTDVSNAASVNLTVGGNTVRLRVNADGSTDIARTAGTDTIKVALMLRWL